jgi:hypothetical protein
MFESTEDFERFKVPWRFRDVKQCFRDFNNKLTGRGNRCHKYSLANAWRKIRRVFHDSEEVDDLPTELKFKKFISDEDRRFVFVTL